jgi:putative heme-binding domain-containing protein
MWAARLGAFVIVSGALLAQQPSPAGDPARGKALFEGKGACLTCHRVNGNGSRMGPDLSEIGVVRGGGRGGPQAAPAPTSNATALETSILDPDAEVLPANRFIRVVTKDGTTLTGRLLNQDSFTVQMLDPQGKLRSFVRSDLREATVIMKSQMPSYKGKLSTQEVADLVSYLSTLKGVDPPMIRQALFKQGGNT